MIKLRDYQIEANNLLLRALSKYRKVVLVVPTGGGKNTLAAYWAYLTLKKNKRLYFVVDGNELVTSFIDRCKEQFDIEIGVIQGNRNDYEQQIIACSMQTLRNRIVEEPDWIIIDECHGVENNSYQKIISSFPNSKIVGITATPFRKDGKHLGNTFEHIIHPKMSRMIELIQKGFLVEHEFIRAKKHISSEGLRKLASGDFDEKEVYEKLSNSVPPSSIVDSYKEYGNGRICFITSPNIKRSKEVYSEFISNGIRCEHINGEMNHEKEVIPILKKVNNGEIKVLCVNNKGLKGLDIPPIEIIILDRLFGSLTQYIQTCGRGSRPFTFKDGRKKQQCLVIDNGDNIIEHGLPKWYDINDFDIFSHEPKKNKELKEPKVKFCPQCEYAMALSVKTCKNCGYSFKKIDVNIQSFGIVYEVLEQEAIILERIHMIDKQKKQKCLKYLTKGTIIIYALMKSKKNINSAIMNAVHILSEWFEPTFKESIQLKAEQLFDSEENRIKYIKDNMFKLGRQILLKYTESEGNLELYNKVLDTFNRERLFN